MPAPMLIDMVSEPLSPCGKTDKGGVRPPEWAIYGPKHIELQNPGKLFDESRVYSIEVPHSIFGSITMVSFYGITGKREQHF